MNADLLPLGTLAHALAERLPRHFEIIDGRLVADGRSAGEEPS